MRTAIIVQARMTSSRLPGKVLLKVLNKPLLEVQIDRLRRVQLADSIIVATTPNHTDQPIVELCEALGIQYFRGPEHDVLRRYREAADALGVDVIIRVTADCPLIDPAVIDKAIRHYAEPPGEFDYVSNTLERSYPRGLDCEVFSVSSLREADEDAISPHEREHVTPYIYEHPDRYRLGRIVYDQNLSHHRWTVDTQEDFELVRRLLESLLPAKPHFAMSDCLMLLEEHPDWYELNAAIEQKGVEQ